MEFFNSVLVQQKNIEEVKVSQHTQTGNEDASNEVQGGPNLGDGVNKYPCFKCNRVKPDYYGAIHFKFMSKSDGSAINTQEIID